MKGKVETTSRVALMICEHKRHTHCRVGETADAVKSSAELLAISWNCWAASTAVNHTYWNCGLRCYIVWVAGLSRWWLWDVICSGVPMDGGRFKHPPPRNSEDPPKSCQTQPDCENIKSAEFRTPTPQDVREKGSKILKLPRFAIVLH